MNKSLLLIVYVLLLSASFTSLAQQNTFSKVVWDTLQGQGIHGNGVVRSFDNGYIVAGNTLIMGYGNYDEDGIVLKIDSNGNVVWNKKITKYVNVLPDVELNSVIATNDSCFLVVGDIADSVGIYLHYPTYNLHAFCAKINANGDTLWSRQITNSGFSSDETSLIEAYSVQQTYDSGYVMTGKAYNANDSTWFIFAAKLDYAGNFEWMNFWSPSNTEGEANSIKQTLDSGYLITGSLYDDSTHSNKAFLMKLSSSGSLVWWKKYSPNNSYGYDLKITSNGFLCCIFKALMKTDTSGNVLWAKEYDGGGLEIQSTFDNDYILSGGTSDLLKIDSSGNVIWGSDLKVSSVDAEAVEANDKGFLVLDFFTSQIGFIKTDSVGHVPGCSDSASFHADSITVFSSPVVVYKSITGGTSFAVPLTISSIGLASDSGCVQKDVSIEEAKPENGIFVYPNPSLDAFTISSGRDVENGTIKIYNTLGQIVFAEIFIGKTKTINCKLSSGVYFVQVASETDRWFSRFVRE